MPFVGAQIQDAQGASSACPAFADLFKVSDTMGDVPLGGFVREIQEVYGASGMDDINSYVADLSKTMSSFVQSEEFRNGTSGLGAEFAW